jgi:pimeloyl-ACP methyl ester carboxylesterase
MKTPVILLHSSAASGRQWQALAEMLRSRHEVHAVDLHGHGTQPAWPGPAPMSLADEAAPVERLLERLGRAHVIGHSYGAAVAVKLASRRPALVRSLVAYEPVLFGLLLDDAFSRREVQTVFGVAASMRSHVAQGRPEAAAQRFIDFWSGHGSWAALSVERQQGAAARMPAVLQQFDALFGDPLTLADLARLRLPTLLCAGGETVPATRRIVQLVHGALPGAQRETFEPMGHMGPVTHAPLFNRRVAEFLQGLGAQHDRNTPPPLPALLRTAP